jgi:hypothetical protein
VFACLSGCPSASNHSTYVGHTVWLYCETMPRGRPRLGKTIAKQAALAETSHRLKMFDKAELDLVKLGGLLSKIVAQAEAMLDNPDLDPFAKAAWAKLLVRDIMDIRPPKLPGMGGGAQTPVVINIGDMPPAPSREPRAIGSGSTESQPRITIDGKPNSG